MRRIRFAQWARVATVGGASFGRLYLFGGLLLVLVVFMLVFEGTGKLASRAAAPQEPPTGSAPPAEDVRRAQEERRQQVPELYGGALADAANGTDFAETKGYRQLVSRFLDHAASSGLPAKTEAWFDYDAAMADPDLFRGDAARVRGLVFWLRAVKLDAPLWGRTDVYRGLLANTDGSHAVAFDVVDVPEGVKIDRDLVDVDGIFYRTVRYENRDGVAKEIPWVLARTFRPLTSESDGVLGFVRRNPAWVLGIFGMAVLWIGLRLVLLVRRARAMRRRGPDRPKMA